MKSKNSYSYTITSSIDEIDADAWDLLTANTSIYLDRCYLRALENSLGEQHQFYYVLIHDLDLKPLSAVVFQSAPFMYTKDKHSKNVSCHFRKNKRGFFTKQMLVCGNIFATGETGFTFAEAVNSSEKGSLLLEAKARVLKFQKKNEELLKTKVTLFKEFWPESHRIPAHLSDNGFHSFQIDVNMVLPIVPHWKSFEDYMLDVKAKYRTRVKSVLKKANTLTLISLSTEQIIQESSRIDVLFENVIAQSDYRFGQMDAATFASLKKELGDIFIFKALYKDELLVGFSTAFLNGDTLEANYVGIDYDDNGTYAIYQRLLYDYVEEAITLGVTSLQLGRTSELLKSSLGAVPVPMMLYAKHSTSITHLLMTTILKRVSASPYELRTPFKADFYKMDLAPLE